MTGHEASRCLSHSYSVFLKVGDLFLDPDECEQMFASDSQLTSRDRGGCRQTFLRVPFCFDVAKKGCD